MTLCHTFCTRLADAGVNIVKIKELLSHTSIVTTMDYIHATDKGSAARSLFYRQHCREGCPNEKPPILQPPQSVEASGAPGMIRTCDPLIRSLKALVLLCVS